MAQKIKIILLFCLAILLITGITSSVPKLIRPIGMPDIGFPTNQLNTDFGLYLVTPSDIYQTEQRISLAVLPGSGDIITFDRVDVRAFLYNQENWIEIKSISLRRSFSKIDVMHAAFPLLTINPSEIHKPAMLHIFFITNIIQISNGKADENMNKKSVSYTDVYLQP